MRIHFLRIFWHPKPWGQQPPKTRPKFQNGVFFLQTKLVINVAPQLPENAWPKIIFFVPEVKRHPEIQKKDPVMGGPTKKKGEKVRTTW